MERGTTQRTLNDLPDEDSNTIGKTPTNLSNRFKGAFLFSAIGDALGWATEFLDADRARRLRIEIPIRDYVRWEKVVGGRWWGYPEQIEPGEYSDDTQLTLSVGRCISQTGSFEPDRFAYLELPLWLNYERGGGKSIKAAARNLISHRPLWFSNFYKYAGVDYRNAGANGAAMRSLPIALVNLGDEQRFIRDSFFNALITHGHPRAIIGSILFGLAVRETLLSEEGGLTTTTFRRLVDTMESTRAIATSDSILRAWSARWDENGPSTRGSFLRTYAACLDEAREYLEAIPKLIEKSPVEYYNLVGALNPATKGSGLSTVCAALYLYAREHEDPQEALLTAVNLLGSDTDTIANFLGALLGARYGMSVVPKRLIERLQDRTYLTKTAERLYAIATGKLADYSAMTAPIKQEDAYLRMLAWEIGLHEMFWDAIDEGGTIVHPALGRGRIRRKWVRDLRREGYVAKLLHVSFESGQTCTFHSRVQNNDKVFESHSADLERALKSWTKSATGTSSHPLDSET